MSTATLETINNLIKLKIESLIEACCILTAHKNSNSVRLDLIIIELKNIYKDYEMGSIKIIADYFLLTNNYQNSITNANEESKRAYILQKEKCYNRYQVFIKKENFISRIEHHYAALKTMYSTLFTSKRSSDAIAVKKLLTTYENSTIIRNTSTSAYNKCPVCNIEMKVISDLSEITCVTCGITETLYGTLFEDEQFYFQEGRRSKHGSYDPSKHCRFWLDRIQAKGSRDIPDNIITIVKDCLTNNGIRNKEDITCSKIRKYLSNTKNSAYNEYIPLIRKIITGESPEQLTDHELQLITMYFDKVIRIYEEIKPNDKTNVPYHPYLIYKIIEHILTTDVHQTYYSKKRMNNILSYIHLQSRETLIENDNTWREITTFIPEIKYKPTDRNAERLL
jgi:hypothetical protein